MCLQAGPNMLTICCCKPLHVSRYSHSVEATDGKCPCCKDHIGVDRLFHEESRRSTSASRLRRRSAERSPSNVFESSGTDSDQEYFTCCICGIVCREGHTVTHSRRCCRDCYNDATVQVLHILQDTAEFGEMMRRGRPESTLPIAHVRTPPSTSHQECAGCRQSRLVRWSRSPYCDECWNRWETRHMAEI